LKLWPDNIRLKTLAGLFALVSQLIFLVVVVPTHTRGAMRVDGKTSGEVDGCCRHDKKKSPTESDRTACAVCYVTARLDTATPTTIEAPAPKLLAVADVAACERGISLPGAAVYDGRAPPM
jgi:hypothetical protein